MPHHIHIDGGNNFKITPSRARGLLTNILSKVRHLSHILLRLVVGHKFYIYNIYANKDVIFRSLGQPLSLIKIFHRDGKMTHMRPLLSIFGRGRIKTPTGGFFPPSPLDKNVNVAYPLILGPGLMDPFSLLLLLGSGWNLNSL